MLPTKTPTPESAAVEGVIFRPGPGETTTDRTPSIEIDFSRLGINGRFTQAFIEYNGNNWAILLGRKIHVAFVVRTIFVFQIQLPVYRIN